MTDVLQFTTDVAQEAGEIMKKYFGQELTRQSKGEPDNFATEADHEAEALIIKAITKSFPDDAILAEESGNHGSADAEHTWIIDPVDGTYNFANTVPDCAVMIARASKNQVEVAVVYNPLRQLFAKASRGSGTYLNDVRVQAPNDVAPPWRIMGFTDTDIERKLKSDRIIIENLRSSGANVLAILQGTHSAFIGRGWIWDIAPVSLLLTEAGLTMSYLTLKSYDWTRAKEIIVAAPAVQHAELVQLLTER
ncbi:MAG: inositol monophosphatase [Candidatus Andersenbacteria bacterium]